jgi:hypothetical protein
MDHQKSLEDYFADRHHAGVEDIKFCVSHRESAGIDQVREEATRFFRAIEAGRVETMALDDAL